MPGSNCSISGCGTCRRNENPYGIFKVPVPRTDDDFHTKWREELIKIICKDREMTDSLERQIRESKLHICEKHFKEDQVYSLSSRKSLNEGALPTLNLPTPESNTIENLFRRSVQEETSMVDEFVGNVRSIRYKDLKSLMTSIEPSKITGWKVIAESENFYVTDENSMKYTSRVVKFYKYEIPYVLPRYEMYVDDSLSFTIRVFGWLLPETHSIYKDNLRSVQFITVSSLISVIEKYSICGGVRDKIHLSDTVKHVIPKEFNIRACDSDPVNQMEYNRSAECMLIIHGSTLCPSCKQVEQKEQKSINRKNKNLQTPAKLRAPMMNTSKERIILALKEQRAENKQLKELIAKTQKEEIKKLKEEIARLEIDLKNSLIPPPPNLYHDLKYVFQSDESRHIPQFMKLFWQEQVKYLLCSGNQIRYDPLVILFSLDLYEKSRAAYEQLRFDERSGKGVLRLPSQRRLRDYKNEIKNSEAKKRAIESENDIFSAAEKRAANSENSTLSTDLNRENTHTTNGTNITLSATNETTPLNSNNEGHIQESDDVSSEGKLERDASESSASIGQNSQSSPAIGQTSERHVFIGQTSESHASIEQTRESSVSIGQTSESSAPIGQTSENSASIGQTSKNSASIGQTSENSASIGQTSESSASIGQSQSKTVNKQKVNKKSLLKNKKNNDGKSSSTKRKSTNGQATANKNKINTVQSSPKKRRANETLAYKK